MISVHRFYVDANAIQGDIATMTGQDAKHLVNVLRLGPNTKVELADGHGTHYLAIIEEVSFKKVVFKIIDTTFGDAESPVHITIAQGMLKDKKMDVILRHLTELGIKEWIPFFASRSVPSPVHSKKKIDPGIIKKSGLHIKTTDARVERWERIVRESIKQCGRSLLPLIHKPISFDDMLSVVGHYGEKITFWEKATISVNEIRETRKIMVQSHLKDHNNTINTSGTQRSAELLHSEQQPENKDQDKIVVMIGPEGGFTEQEIEVAKQNGFNAFSLGNRILRAETASIAACTLIQNIFGDI